ncbi:hypothetical protein FOZ62_024676 [Perkinsus olseni]|uniref:Uncharacterized protein n=1 Tax=Perkinsus olseni TaxID=32597 RepID=A0A7J6QHC0_PEROL|nr:hypothetical protein FOZ62_024676 [Perkinsus olseni]
MLPPTLAIRMCGALAGANAGIRISPVPEYRPTISTPRLINMKLIRGRTMVLQGQLKVSSLELLPRKADTSLPTSLRNLAPSKRRTKDE